MTVDLLCRRVSNLITQSQKISESYTLKLNNDVFPLDKII